MKLVRYGVKGKEKPGIIDSDGNIRDLSKKINDIDGSNLSAAKLKNMSSINVNRLPVVKGKKRYVENDPAEVEGFFFGRGWSLNAVFL